MEVSPITDRDVSPRIDEVAQGLCPVTGIGELRHID
jgi:hypothetical protein